MIIFPLARLSEREALLFDYYSPEKLISREMLVWMSDYSLSLLRLFCNLKSVVKRVIWIAKPETGDTNRAAIGRRASLRPPMSPSQSKRL